MCGRFVTRAEAAIERAFNMIPRQMPRELSRFNVAPTQSVPVVRTVDDQRVGDMLRWGLVPAWAKGQPTKYSTNNARAETFTGAASYRNAWKHGQRCVIPALGYYEWKPVANGKQPYYFHIADGQPFGFCGLWESSTAPEGETLESFTIITVRANPMVAEIHPKARMPAMLMPQDCAGWLEGSTDDAYALLQPFPAERMGAYPVSTRVNSPRNDDPDLLERVA